MHLHGSRCRTTSAQKERSSTCHHVSDRSLSLHSLTSLSCVSTTSLISSSSLSWSSSSMWSKPPSTKSLAHPQNEEYCPVAIHNPLTSFSFSFSFLMNFHLCLCFLNNALLILHVFVILDCHSLQRVGTFIRINFMCQCSDSLFHPDSFSVESLSQLTVHLLHGSSHWIQVIWKCGSMMTVHNDIVA